MGLGIPEGEDSAQRITANLSSKFDGMESTPDGMSMPDSSGSQVNYDSIELPPVTTRIPKQNSVDEGGKVDEPPALSATDTEMDPYRNMALKEYQLNWYYGTLTITARSDENW